MFGRYPIAQDAALEAPTRRRSSVDDRPAVAGGAKRLRARAPVGEPTAAGEQVEDGNGSGAAERKPPAG